MARLNLTNGKETVSIEIRTQGAGGTFLRNSFRRGLRRRSRSGLFRGLMTVRNMQDRRNIGTVDQSTINEINSYLNAGYTPKTQADEQLLESLK